MGLAKRFGMASLALVACTGCIGAVAGTIIDTTRSALLFPVNEYLFAGAYRFDNDADAPWRPLEDDRARDYGYELIGVAASGGGSRAAYFLACVLDEMRRVYVPGPAGEPPHSLLDEVDYLSGVSGGSLASAYYALQRPAGADEAALDAFFARYREDMRKDFELRSLGRTIFLFRGVPLLLTYYHRGHVMASTWDANFFHDRTFADLPEPRPPHPSLIINATSYSSGEKFLFTRIPTSRFNDSTTFRELRRGRLIVDGYDEGHRPLYSEGFDTIDSDIGSFRLSLAAVASAGVPNLLGPVMLKDRSREDALVALGDGGIYDNYGLETLVQLFASILEERPGQRAQILVVDGSGYVPVETEAVDYSVAGYADRTVTIAWLRAADYAEPVFGSQPRLRIRVLSLYHRGGGREEEPGGVRRAVGAVFEPVVGFVGDLNESTRAIGTRFRLSDDHADLIETQAAVVVNDVLRGAEGPAPVGREPGPARPASSSPPVPRGPES